MKRPAPSLLAVVLLVLLTAVPLVVKAGMVEAYLDPTCTTINGAFTVPAGTAAVNFTATMSSPWRACSVDYPIDTIGFMIVDSTNKRYYAYAEYKDGTSQDLEGSLKGLSLGPGSYNVHVQGGLDTRVRLTFDIVTDRVIFTP